ncbi:MAG: hypothetical protein KKB50_06230 [Planctomycetes bacterium]|nr:hypothetical protein [Planctomycetota bacterium]
MPPLSAPVTEVLKSWWNRGKQPPASYYGDKDGKEIDLLLIQDQVFYPVAIKKSASPRREWAQPFVALDRLRPDRPEGGVVCLCRQRLPLTDKVTAIPVGLL